MTIAVDDITGLVLCGGRGSRMGGVDKGLELHAGLPLVQHALQRLAPQVGRLAINANRNLAEYAALGLPVWPDALAGYVGPLAGWLAGLTNCRTPYLAAVPCDTPRFPADLVARLADALQREDAQVAMAATREGGRVLPQPVFCLLRADLAPSLQAALDRGDRKVGLWAAQQRCAQVVFDDADAFFNVNTAQDLQELGRGVG